nr:MAG TPA: hypothetical protein [Caudoviricetes sp.]
MSTFSMCVRYVRRTRDMHTSIRYFKNSHETYTCTQKIFSKKCIKRVYIRKKRDII